MHTILAALIASVLCAPDPAPKEPGLPANTIAVVLDTPISASSRDRVNGIIFSSLIARFAEVNGLEPSDEEVQAMVDHTRRASERRNEELRKRRGELRAEIAERDNLVEPGMLEKKEELAHVEKMLATLSLRDTVAPLKPEQAREIELMAVRPFVARWKVNKALHEKYGGRVAFQQAGLEPVDAYRAFLKEQEAAGAFRFTDDETRAAFWGYWSDDSIHHFLPDEPDATPFDKPWWLMEQDE